MRSIVTSSNGGRPVLARRAYGAFSDSNSVHGTTRFISSRNTALRVRRVLTVQAEFLLGHDAIVPVGPRSHHSGLTRVLNTILSKMDRQAIDQIYAKGHSEQRSWSRLQETRDKRPLHNG